MTFRGIVRDGVVVIDGETPPEGSLVEVKPIESTAETTELPAFGLWRERSDLNDDSANAAQDLRQRLLRRGHG